MSVNAPKKIPLEKGLWTLTKKKYHNQFSAANSIFKHKYLDSKYASYPFNQISNPSSKSPKNIIVTHKRIVKGIMEKPRNNDGWIRTNFRQQDGSLHTML